MKNLILLRFNSTSFFINYIFRIIYKSENQYLIKFKIFLNEFKEGLMSTYKIKKDIFISLTLLIWILYLDVLRYEMEYD